MAKPTADPAALDDPAAANDPPDLAWLDALEQRVREAAARLRELTDDNAALAARVEELERALEESTPEGDEKAAAAWRQEREDVRRRVERLTEGLESLLDED